MTEESYEIIQTHFRKMRWKLSGVIRNAYENGSKIHITRGNLKQLIDSARVPRTPFDAIDRLLIYISKKITPAGDSISIHKTDFSIVYGKNENELEYYLGKANEMKYIELVDAYLFRLTLPGWKKIEDLNKTKAVSDQAFVAMWFNPRMDLVWENGFKPALEEVGYRPLRADKVEHNWRIDDWIIAEIRRSGILIADFTRNRGGVYFEAGFALGLDIPVIWTCRKDWMKKTHFDTEHYNHIVWETPEELKNKLVLRIRATAPRRTETK